MFSALKIQASVQVIGSRVLQDSCSAPATGRPLKVRSESVIAVDRANELVTALVVMFGFRRNRIK